MENSDTKILVTGGAGYIGSHTVVKLSESGYKVVIYDNFSNSNRRVLERIKLLAKSNVECIEGDIRDKSKLREIFSYHNISSVIHFAGLKAVSESEIKPLMYFSNNLNGSIALLEEMDVAGVNSIVFSSSATVYGNPGYHKFSESTILSPINIYGHTKYLFENVLTQIKRTKPSWQIAILRYFNPVGAHPSGLIGESPNGSPNNLMPYLSQVAIGKRKKLTIFGGDYETFDGTGKRDYIHVEDLASGHLAALRLLCSGSNTFFTVNLGTGRSYSVLELLRAYERASGKPIPFQISGRRPGDLSEYYADPSFAKILLGWEAQYDLDRMCEDAWRWQCNNPNGYEY